jgi:hypothetical protein
MTKFTVALCSLILLLGFTLLCQEHRDNRINFGGQWNSWSTNDRLVYLSGFMDGQSETYSTLLSDLPEGSRERLRKATFLFYDLDVIRDVITDVYRDPANTFIRFSSIVYVARDKLDGKDVESRLRYARQHEYALPAR